jgi:hypothetical protein
MMLVCARGGGTTAPAGQCYCMDTQFIVNTKQLPQPATLLAPSNSLRNTPQYIQGPFSKIASGGKQEERSKGVLGLKNPPYLYWRHHYCHVIKRRHTWTPTVR